VQEAAEAIQQKLRACTDGEISDAERQALRDALQNLRVLQREYS
jgi:tellurite resistance protein